MKKCRACHINKNLEQFTKDRTTKDGLSRRCKTCIKNKVNSYFIYNKEKGTMTCSLCKEEKLLDKFYKDRTKSSGHGSICKTCKLIKNRKYYTKYLKKDVQKLSKEESKRRVNKYRKIRRKNDPLFKLKGNLRTRIYSLMVGEYAKNKSTEEMIGCTFEEAKKHIESTFKEGMTWENHGRCKGDNCNEVWHIDHEVPLASAKTEEGLLKLFHYTNLQALWADENLSKGCN